MEKLKESLMKRRAARALAARQSSQVCKGARARLDEDNDARVAYSNDCFVLGVQHYHGSQLLAAVMDRWP